MEYIKEHKRGFIGTIIFHIIILILLIFFGFITPLPLPGEEGILVNFGDSETGLGEIEPSPAESEAAPVQPVQQEEKEEVPPPPVTSPPKPQPKPAAAKEAVLTQDFEKTAAIDAAENKKKADEQKRKDLLEEQSLAEAREAERIKNIEAEKIRKVEADKIAKAEAERKKISEINSRAQGAFASKGNGTGGKGTGDGKSQGVTFPGGNQGTPTGDPNSNNYGQGGNGNQGSGISYDLGNRKHTLLLTPEFPVKEEGKVVVEVFVDNLGNVTSARAGIQGTSIQNSSIWESARQAALKSKFEKDTKQSQKGTITYVFRPK